MWMRTSSSEIVLWESDEEICLLDSRESPLTGSGHERELWPVSTVVNF